MFLDKGLISKEKEIPSLWYSSEIIVVVHFYILIMKSEGVDFIRKISFGIFIKSLRFETPWVR